MSSLSRYLSYRCYYTLGNDKNARDSETSSEWQYGKCVLPCLNACHSERAARGIRAYHLWKDNKGRCLDELDMTIQPGLLHPVAGLFWYGWYPLISLAFSYNEINFLNIVKYKYEWRLRDFQAYVLSQFRLPTDWYWDFFLVQSSEIRPKIPAPEKCWSGGG